MIHIRTEQELQQIRVACRLAADTMATVRDAIRPGISTADIAQVAREYIEGHGGKAAFLGYQGYPGAICVSVNDEVVHGIPGDRVLQTGDAVSIDCGVRMAGYCGDAARTVPVGVVAPEVTRLLQVTEEALQLAIAEVAPGRMWSEVAARIQQHVESAGMAVIRDFVGHGIGQEMHEEPKVPNYHDRSQRKSDFCLEEGLTLAVEPMVTLGRCDVMYADADAWVIVTKDGSYAAHFEHSIAMTAKGPLILTAA